MIHVDVKTTYLKEQSDASKHQYVYAYTIRIENKGNETAKLISRHWIITDANSRVQEVKGEGVVGEQPALAPGEVYTYTSGVVLETSSGTMEGSYTMRKDNGEEFQAEIPTFALVQPHALH